VATLREIRRRIRSIESTQKITRAMQMVAAAKFSRAQGDVRTLRPYAEGMETLLGHFLRSGHVVDHPLLAREEVKRRVLVVVASDRGMCGAYNSNVLRAAVQELDRPDSGDVAVIPLGKRASDFFRKQAWEIAYDSVLGDRLSMSKAEDLARNVERLYVTGAVDQVDVLYTRFISTLKREVLVSPLLGIRLDVEEHAAGVPYLIEPSVEELLADLLPRVLTTRITAVLAEVLASEHSARMIAMQSATDNAKELIEELTLIRNRMRQSAITKELADIVGSAEAMK